MAELRKSLKTALAEIKAQGVRTKAMAVRDQGSRGGECPGDLLQVHCKRPDVLGSLIECLKKAVDAARKTPGGESARLWVRVPGGMPLSVKGPSVPEKLRAQAERLTRRLLEAREEDLALLVAAYRGEAGIKAFQKARKKHPKLPLEQVAEEAIRSVKLPRSPETFRLAF